MELRVLRYFITIAEEGSISKASEKLELQLLLNNRVSNQNENRGLDLGFFVFQGSVLFKQRSFQSY